MPTVTHIVRPVVSKLQLTASCMSKLQHRKRGAIKLLLTARPSAFC